MTQFTASCRRTLAALALLGLTGTAAAAPCDPARHEWVPTRYYGQGEVVHHDGRWYQAREFQEGRTPGAAFEWQALDTVPGCDEPDTESPATQAADGQEPGAGAPAHAGDGHSDSARKHPPSNAGAGKGSVKGSGHNNDSRAREQGGQPAARPCPEASDWSFAVSYSVGTRVQFKGQTWRAIRPSNGSMPGVGMPPAWEAAPAGCGR